MVEKRTYPGINIQWPYSEWILEGKKTIETRTYPIPQKYLGKEMVLMETPGKKGQFRARATGIVIFTECFEYKSNEDFYLDSNLHRVDKESYWAYVDRVGKWGWRVDVVEKFAMPIYPNRRCGIIFSKKIEIYK